MLLTLLILMLVSFCPTMGAAEDKISAPPTNAESGDSDPFAPVQFGQGVEFRNPSSGFLMNMRFRMQNRATVFSPEELEESEDVLNDWRIRRMRLRFNGHVVNERLNYLVQLSFSRNDQDFEDTGFSNIIRDGWMTYALTPGFSLGFGQAKLPSNRQRVVSSGDLQFTDRSILNGTFTLDRDMGFQTRSRFEPKGLGEVYFKTSISSGEGRNSSAQPNSKAFLVARLEWLPMGAFINGGDYSESALAYEATPKLSLGWTHSYLGGARRQNGTIGAFLESRLDEQATPRVDQEVQFFDMMLKWRRLSVLFEYAHRTAKSPMSTLQTPLFIGGGTNLQVGHMVTETQELAMRTAHLQSDHGERQNRYERALVWNNFLKGHRVKIQTEIGQTHRQDYLRMQIELGI